MQSERWSRCTEIFSAVVELPPNERVDFIRKSCAGNDVLRRRVELLLKYHNQSDGFLETPAFETAPDFLLGDNDALLGRQFGFYRIDSILGVGGMGVVYLAEDERLGRKVGLKLLPPSLAADDRQLQKLKLEARTASALNHPNIVTIHEIGEVDGTHYITTEYIEGITLRERINQGPMPPKEAIEIAQQIAGALSVAHAAGIVHRDIKPENIMLRPDGYVKILDFGIAKFTQANVSTGTQTATHNLVIGTARYMSPEQARGSPIDGRTDVWSLGVVLFEMVAGSPPFGGETNTDVIASVLRSDPPPLDRSIPDGLRLTINRAIAKDSAARFQTATELRDRLHQIARSPGRSVTHFRRTVTVVAATIILAFIGTWLWQGPNKLLANDRPSIAVLPLQNLSADPKDGFFAQGIQDEILTRLSKIAAMKVISRTSTQRYQSAPDDTRKIGHELNVTNLVEGSIQKVGNMIKVNVQLIRADRDEHLWAESYSRPLTDIFGIEGEVAAAIAQQLNVKLTGAEEKALIDRPTSNAAAYEAYLRGVAVESTHVSDNTALAEAAADYGEAVQIDPKFALAWSHLAIAHSLLYVLGKDTAEHSAAVKMGAERSMALDPQQAESWIAQGIYRYRIGRDFPGALQAYEEALKRWPNSALALEQIAYLERRMGRWETGLEHLRHALSLDPNNIKLMEALKGTFLISLRRYDEVDALNARISAFGVDDETTFANRALEFHIRGQLDKAAELLGKIKGDSANDLIERARISQLALERRFEEAIAKTEKQLASVLNSSATLSEDAQTRLTMLGFYQEWAGRPSEAHQTFARAVEAMKPSPDTAVPVTPKKLPCYLALAYAGLGEKERALEQGRRAVEDYRDDAVDRPYAEWTLAQIQARFGDYDSAIGALPHLLEVPNGVTIGKLRFDPLWDPLRNDPRFQKLIASGAANDAASAPRNISTKSIAVLPFENRSSDPDNAFFTDGVQDEILTNLAKIADLKVISRTSTAQYKTGTPRNLREIGNALGVAHIVEGSVQRTGNRVRVNARLIDAQTDGQVWAQSYDRALADVFAIQSEIATAIADQLQVRLSPREKKAIELPPTNDIAAFDLYTRGKEFILKAKMGSAPAADLLQASQLLEQAVTRDPSFFNAYCELAFAHDSLYMLVDGQPAHLARAAAAIDSASRLRPDADETHLARAQHLYHGLRDYQGALTELELARRSLPNDARIYQVMGFIQRRQKGRYEEATQMLEHALDLDPGNAVTLNQIASFNYRRLKRHADAKSIWYRLLALRPDDNNAKISRAVVDFDWNADTRLLHQTIDSIHTLGPDAFKSIAGGRLLCALAERDAAAAKEALEASGDESITVWAEDVLLSRSILEGVIGRMTHNDTLSRSAFSRAYVEQKKIIHAQPDFGPAVCLLGLIEAGLGQKEEALREGRRAMELLPVEKDLPDGMDMIKYFAMIAAWVGDQDLACHQLDIAVHGPSGLTYGELKLLPFWDPLRGNPRFEKIVASLAPDGKK